MEEVSEVIGEGLDGAGELLGGGEADADGYAASPGFEVFGGGGRGEPEGELIDGEGVSLGDGLEGEAGVGEVGEEGVWAGGGGGHRRVMYGICGRSL